jgi:signal transduction histidine kinase
MMMDVTSHLINYKGRPSVLALAENITDKLLTEEELKRSYEDIRQLNAHLQTVREEERKRIGREIHDELGQQLTAIKMDTVWIDKQIPSETVGIKNKLQNIIELLDGSHGSVRKILNELRPSVLDENDLVEALQWQGQQFKESTGRAIHFTTNQNDIKLPHEIATSIFRLYQEALTNIMRYAEADKVLSSLNVVNNSIFLTIEDDGKGFDPSMINNKKSFGILGMKERVLSLKGKFDLTSSPGKGTKIVITLPYIDNVVTMTI